MKNSCGLIKPAGRFDYVKYDEVAQVKSAGFKEKFQQIEELISGLMPGNYGRPVNNALTALEEAFMWCGKAIRDEQVANRPAETTGAT